jgi:hypothetical protein
MISADDLFRAVVQMGIRPTIVQTADAHYDLPAADWFIGSFAQSLHEALDALNLVRYQPQSNDCDDYARMGASLAQLLHFHTRPRGTTGLAVGEFWYQIRNMGGAHAICVAITRLSPTSPLQLMALEPQNQTPVILTPQEIQSCSFVRF